jgi:O-succinylhomoserine sulfhydrylase
VRAGQERSQFNEHSEALYLTSSFVFTSAAQAAARFSGEEEGNVYSRFTNPTVAAFQDRLAALEGAEACVATASGMSAILSLVMALCSSGDHIVASTGLFGATQQLARHHHAALRNPDQLCRADRRRGMAGGDAAGNQAALSRNPVESADRDRRHRRPGDDRPCAWRLLVVVDNCFCTPILQRPLDLGADLVVHSATKFLDGQGRVLGGAVAGPRSADRRGLQVPAHGRPDALGIQRLGSAQGPRDAADCA